MKHVIEAKLNTWMLFGNERKFITVTVPFEVAADIFKPMLYNGKSGRGEQREIHEAHRRKLQKEMANGTYTPTPVSVGTHKSHREAMVVVDDVVTLEVEKATALPLTDGGHRFAAIHQILEGLVSRQKAAKAEGEQQILSGQIEQVYKLPVTAIIYLDGDPQTDFVNLQAGRAVDTSHLLTMKIRRNMGTAPELTAAFEIVKALADSESGPYVGQVRFDSRGLMPLPISSLCSKSASDLSTSIVGLSRVCGKLKPKEVAKIVNDLYATLKADSPEVLEYGKVLTPISEGGTKGSATMFIGVAICLIHDYCYV